jgi:NADPH:quinone reductase
MQQHINLQILLAERPARLPGLTSYFGLLDIAQPGQGEIVVVSGAVDAVETVIGQIAKIHGCRVIGITESDKKTKYLIDELGFDAAIIYRTSHDLKEMLAKACPNGVDISFDNVGGDIADEELETAPESFIGMSVGKNIVKQLVNVA